MKRRSSYKVTFFDRHGPEGELLLRAIGSAIMPTALGGIMLIVLGSMMLNLGGLALVLFTLVGTATLGVGAVYFSLKAGSAAGDVAAKVYMGGDTTPYEEQFSQEQALVMQRDYATALALFEQRITLAPGEPRVRMAAADLYATHGENPKRAAELYREVQRIPEVKSGHDVYVSNKLADLYLGPLKEPRRALVEFRRLIERYPGSAAAGHAKLALSNLKGDLVKDAEEKA
jgi:tetratricopeptide (TPR) repeat protein